MKLVKIMVLLQLLLAALPVFAGNPPSVPSGGVVSGQVMIGDKSPMSKAVVLVYSDYTGPPPNPYKYWRIPDQVFAGDEQGRFSLNLEEGRYYLMIAQKKMDGEIGPPMESEYLYFHADAEGNAKPLNVVNGSSVNLGRLQGYLWTPEMSERVKGVTSIEGVVVDMEGKPVNNVLVLSYYTREARRRPAFISERTDKNGRFVIRVAEGGDYWLRVRGVIGGGAPEAGEYLNTTDDFEPFMVSIAAGQKLAGVLLRVKVFDGIGSTGKPKPEKVWKRVNDPKPVPATPPQGKKK